MARKISPQKLEELAQRLDWEIEESLSRTNALKDRWDTNEKLYHTDPSVTNLTLIEGMAGYAMPTYPQKVDRIRDSVMDGVCPVGNWWQIVEDVPQGTEDEALERAFMKLAEDGGLKNIVSPAVVAACNTNAAFIRVQPKVKDGRFVGVEHEFIHPRHTIAYPNSRVSLNDCKTVGHRLYRQLWEIQEDQKSGRYLKGDLVAGDDPDEYERSGGFERSREVEAQDPLDEFVELFDLVTHCDLGNGRMRYIVTLAKSSRKILRIEEYPYRRVWYSRARLFTAEKRIYSDDAPGYRAQGPCLAINDFYTAITHGSMLCSIPAQAVIGATGMQAKFRTIRPGDILELPEGSQVVKLSPEFNAEHMPALLDKTEQYLDGGLGISRVSSSQEVDTNTKATTINALTAADQRTQDRFAEAFAEVFDEIGEMYFDFVRLHAQDLVWWYGKAWPLEPMGEWQAKDWTIKATGRSSSANPQVLLQKLNGLLELTMNPASPMDATKVITRIAQALDLPFDPTALQKDSVSALNEMLLMAEQSGIDPQEILARVQASIQEAMQERAAAQAGFQEGYGATSDGGGTVPPVQNPGMANAQAPMALGADAATGIAA